MRHRTLTTCALAAALTTTALAAAAPASATEEPAEGVGPATVTFVWFIPDYPIDGAKPTADDPRLWTTDQVLFDGSQYGWCQVDSGPSPAPEFGPTLTKGEDYSWVQSWDFTLCGTAPEEPAEPTEPTPPVEEPIPPVQPSAPPAAEPAVQAPAVEPVAVIAAPAPVAQPELAETGPATLSLIPIAGALLFAGIITRAATLRRRASRS